MVATINDIERQTKTRDIRLLVPASAPPFIQTLGLLISTFFGYALVALTLVVYLARHYAYRYT